MHRDRQFLAAGFGEHECPLWVINCRATCSVSRPLYPQKQPRHSLTGAAAKGQQRPHALQQGPRDSTGRPIIAKISQETLAEMIGTTRSRVSFFMNKFRELGFIDYNGSIEDGIEVHTSLLNAVLHDQPQIRT
jgi:hypothetical protein